MTALDPSYHNLIRFVAEKETDNKNDQEIKGYSKSIPNVSGEEIRHFYESLVQEPSCHSSSDCNNDRNITHISGNNKRQHSAIENRHAKRHSSRCTLSRDEVSKPTTNQSLLKEQRQYFHFLKSAQTGNLCEVQNLLTEGLNINHRDFYGWTALMCAAKEGHCDMVDYLLHSGADKDIVNTNGHTAATLAKNAGHHLLEDKIKHYNAHSLNCSLDSTDSHLPKDVVMLYCQTCKSEFLSTDKILHETSTVHLFNNKQKHKKLYYLIPETNRGFQMLLKTGWDKDKGLGPKGEGCKYPVKTVLKQDRTGLGAKDTDKKRAKITHFNPGDVAAINSKPLKRLMSARKAAKLAAKATEKNEKKLEQKLRFQLNGDFY